MTTMTRHYDVRAIRPEVLTGLRRVDDAGRMPLVVEDADGGSPLRCCLRLTRPGEQVFLVSYAPLRRWATDNGVDPAAYDEVGPVFIHCEDCGGYGADGYPEELRGIRRMLRAYSGAGRILFGRLLEADEDAEAVLDSLMHDERVAVIHARAVEFGCFTFEVARSTAAVG